MKKKILESAIKIEMINQLSQTGLSVIEATSFVSPKWIPQLADHADVFTHIVKQKNVSYPVFVPNVKGLEKAIACGVKDIAIFATPSETFSRRNINASVDENLEAIAEMIKIAEFNKIRVRGYVSCVLGCPYEGEMASDAVATLSKKLLTLGVDEISLGDTIGVGTPGKTDHLLKTVMKKIPREKIAVHFHDTYGQALANIYVALQNGIAIIDSSVAGLGGCPYAKGASGNAATEDVLYMLNGLGIETGVDLESIIKVGRFISNALEKPVQSKVNLAYHIKL